MKRISQFIVYRTHGSDVDDDDFDEDEEFDVFNADVEIGRFIDLSPTLSHHFRGFHRPP